MDVQDDSRHCGACFHDCQGGACSFGQCDEVTVARSLTDVYGIAVGDDVYFTASASVKKNFVARAPKRGVAPCDGADERCILDIPPLFVAANGDGLMPRGLDLTPSALYIGYLSQGIVEHSLLTGANQIFATTPMQSPFELLVAGNAVFLTGRGHEVLVRVPRNGEPQPVVSFTLHDNALATELALSSDGTGVFTAIEDDGISAADLRGVGLHRADATGTAAPCQDASCLVIPGRPVTLASGGGWAVLARVSSNPGRPEVVRIRPGGDCDGRAPCPEPVLQGVQIPGKGALALDDRHLYWVRSLGAQGTPRCEVRRMPVEQTCVETEGRVCGELFMEPKPSLVKLAQDASSLYATYSDGDVRIVRKAK